MNANVDSSNGTRTVSPHSGSGAGEY
jgi:hypothetical protein